MNAALIGSCMQRAHVYVEKQNDGTEVIIDRDTIIHVGDLASFGTDRGSKGLDCNPAKLISSIPALFVNIRGNHDVNNRVKSICESMRTNLGKRFPNVSVSHYPSYDSHVGGNVKNGDIHICGHVHKKWKHCLDLDRQILNINVGVDVWNYRIITEDELIQYIEKVLRLPKEQVTKVKSVNGKLKYV